MDCHPLPPTQRAPAPRIEARPAQAPSPAAKAQGHWRRVRGRSRGRPQEKWFGGRPGQMPRASLCPSALLPAMLPVQSTDRAAAWRPVHDTWCLFDESWLGDRPFRQLLLSGGFLRHTYPAASAERSAARKDTGLASTHYMPARLLMGEAEGLCERGQNCGRFFAAAFCTRLLSHP